MNAQPTQVNYPWRAAARTAFQVLVALAAMLPLIYSAASGGSPEAATGWAALALAIAAGVTRVMALPTVNAFLGSWLPWLAARPARPDNEGA